ncbi:hypothetical protein Pelo_5527 [Pelomyxa schiedti]|nr:hypothetical protein Pelo_5527 [Pelomyxa schiedti]
MSTALVVRRQQCTLLDMWSSPVHSESFAEVSLDTLKKSAEVFGMDQKKAAIIIHTAQVWDQARPSKYQKVPKDTQLEIVKTIVNSHCLTIPEFLHSSPLVRQFILPATTIRT